MSRPTRMVLFALVLLLAAYGCAGPDAPGILVFNNVRVFDGEQTHEQAQVIVENGLIRDVGTDLPIPARAHVSGCPDLRCRARLGRVQISAIEFLRDRCPCLLEDHLFWWASHRSVRLPDR